MKLDTEYKGWIMEIVTMICNEFNAIISNLTCRACSFCKLQSILITTCFRCVRICVHYVFKI